MSKPKQKQRNSSPKNQSNKKLRAHKLIAKIPHTSKYKVIKKEYRISGVSLKLKKKEIHCF
ncbi:hypothetical protein BIY37_11475 [Candidatus Brocadia sapporoensis]|uniref:Uncharacterized protein n=1 Tax=Candidatus Brocadia sapporoensis TaxID=392547 RepID=A0A1V6LXH4_9BACT|nr:hypothetical protein BIY37_11475 [Candidatus Brocadia sapporoensis]TVL95998.1 MAG: hypothetical protein CV082_08665 [Candidatus Brocadia sp. BL1]